MEKGKQSSSPQKMSKKITPVYTTDPKEAGKTKH